MRFDLNNFTDEETDNWLFVGGLVLVVLAIIFK